MYRAQTKISKMKLYRAKINKYKIIYQEFKIISETDHYYSINAFTHPGSKILKKVRKEAKHPFAAKTKKQALETLLHNLEGLRFTKFPRDHPFRDSLEIGIRIIEKAISDLKE